MTDDKIKDSIQIAEELTEEICTGKPSASLLAEEWKRQSPDLYKDLLQQKDLYKRIAFYDSVDTEDAMKRVQQKLFPVSRKRQLSICIAGIAASFLLIAGSMLLGKN